VFNVGRQRKSRVMLDLSSIAEFEQFCNDKRVPVLFAPPTHQEGNHFSEKTWQSLSWYMLARLSNIYLYHALLHACHVLPLKDLVTIDGVITTSYELFVGSRPKVSEGFIYVFHRFRKELYSIY